MVELVIAQLNLESFELRMGQTNEILARQPCREKRRGRVHVVYGFIWIPNTINEHAPRLGLRYSTSVVLDNCMLITLSIPENDKEKSNV